ncbi:MAG TPA: hypothetical protein VM846_10745, partial [Vicinamibacterales bacterium]|nr:hypothetical protein [Vicinamibacterales bacterium]
MTSHIMRRITIVLALMTLAAVVHPVAQQPATRTPSAVKPGQSFKECRNCPEMVVVPAGTFMMGSPANEPERRENEPQHRV